MLVSATSSVGRTGVGLAVKLGAEEIVGEIETVGKNDGTGETDGAGVTQFVGERLHGPEPVSQTLEQSNRLVPL